MSALDEFLSRVPWGTDVTISRFNEWSVRYYERRRDGFAQGGGEGASIEEAVSAALASWESGRDWLDKEQAKRLAARIGEFGQ